MQKNAVLFSFVLWYCFELNFNNFEKSINVCKLACSYTEFWQLLCWNEKIIHGIWKK